MPDQPNAAPKYRRVAFIAIALLLIALTVGSVTVVYLFPTKASESTNALPNRPAFPAQPAAPAVDREAVLERFRAQERGVPAPAVDQAAPRVWQAWTERLNGLANAHIHGR